MRRSGNSPWKRIFLSSVGEMSRAARLALVERDGSLSVSRQRALPGVSRSAFHRPAPEMGQADPDLMRRMDVPHLEHPSHGARRMVSHLRLHQGVRTSRNRVRRLMRLMGLCAIAAKPATSAGAPQHRTFPYLPRGLDITDPDQAWCSDITCIPIRGGFMCLVAVMDWATRFVLSWRLSNCLDAACCPDGLAAALADGRSPGICFTPKVVSEIGPSSPVARSVFDIFLEGNALIYVKNPCRKDDIAPRFFLHAPPTGQRSPSGLTVLCGGTCWIATTAAM